MIELPPTTALADVLRLCGVEGCLTPPLAAMTPSPQRVCGRATTVQMQPGAVAGGGAFEELYALLSSDLSGCAVVVAGAAAVPGAVWGQILSRAAAGSGAVAAVIDGAVRDRVELATEGLPVYAQGENTTGAVGLAHVEAVGVEVTIAGVRVVPGDLIVLDAAGTVCLPQERADGLVGAARRLAAAEADTLEELARGRRLIDAYEHKRAVIAALRAEQMSSIGSPVS